MATMRVVTMTDCTEEGINDGEGDELQNAYEIHAGKVQEIT